MNTPEDRRKQIDEMIERHRAEITARQKRYEEANDMPIVLLYAVALVLGVLATLIIFQWLTNN